MVCIVLLPKIPSHHNYRNMSEFSKAYAKALDIEKLLSRDDETPTITELEEIKDILDQTLFPLSQKYTAKLSEVDPITGAPRLGPAMSTKVLHLVSLAESISVRNTELLKQAAPAEPALETPSVFETIIAPPVAPKSLNESFQTAMFDKANPFEHSVCEQVDCEISYRASALREMRKQQLSQEQCRIDAELKRLREFPVGVEAVRSRLSDMKDKIEVCSSCNSTFLATVRSNLILT